ncbi:cytochrome b-245 chaperone 1 homolog [Pygocentrus nattereri]|uniref:Essential for reactive oxygen species protein n=1 Tax=Pygocentrus nattereri TaxID=42514 RepID=A0AAR2JF47_PYGNA|nr:cytochrome b-245 chaperone 1 homolog [Pygocentrus nattereri]
MVYMVIERHTADVLHLKRSPGIRSWSLLVGIASIGLAAAYYSSDSVIWKLFYVTGCLFVALQNIEEWEEAVFDKSKGRIELKTFSLYARILTLWSKGHEKVLLDLRHLRDICVQEEKVRYLGKGYVLVLRMATGFSHPLTQNATLGHRGDVEALAALLKRFLKLGASQQQPAQEDEDDFGDEDEEDFEQLGMEGDDESSDSRDESELTPH